jgi:hypothetical protein
MNEGRSLWLTDAELLKACEQFLVEDGFEKLELERQFETEHSRFVSPVTGIRNLSGGETEILATFIRPRIDKYEVSLQSSIESALYSVVDNYSAELALVTDSLSYTAITRNPELNVEFESLMDEGLLLLFLNGRSGHAKFDAFSKLTSPVAIED